MDDEHLLENLRSQDVTKNSTIANRSREAARYVDGMYCKSVALKSGLQLTEGHWKWHSSIDRIRVSNSDGAILYRLRDSELLVENREIFISTCIYCPRRGWHRGISRRCLIGLLIKLEWLSYRVVKKLRRYVKLPERTDWRTDTIFISIRPSALCDWHWTIRHYVGNL